MMKLATCLQTQTIYPILNLAMIANVPDEITKVNSAKAKVAAPSQFRVKDITHVFFFPYYDLDVTKDVSIAHI